MPTPLTELDDKKYDDLLAEALASIPKLYPSWTDHNASDPGVALIELFAWLTDMVLYRVNRLPDARYLAFLRLMRGPGFELEPGQTLDDGIRETLREIRELYRAVSADDYEYLTKHQWPLSDPDALLGRIARVKCLPERNLEEADKLAAAPGYISLMVVPESGDGTAPWLQPSAALKSGLLSFFDSRRLITTRVRVTGPTYVPISIAATIYLKDYADPNEVTDAAKKTLQGAFHPVHGSDDGKGWPFGGNLNLGTIYALLDGIRGIDFTEDVVVTVAEADRLIMDGDEVLMIELDDFELLQLEESSINFARKARSGDSWKLI
jgi:hypothetical protein